MVLLGHVGPGGFGGTALKFEEVLQVRLGCEGITDTMGRGEVGGEMMMSAW